MNDIVHPITQQDYEGMTDERIYSSINENLSIAGYADSIQFEGRILLGAVDITTTGLSVANRFVGDTLGQERSETTKRR